MAYSGNIREEELKNRVAHDWFSAYDSTDTEYTRLIKELRSRFRTLAAKLAPKVYLHRFLLS